MSREKWVIVITYIIVENGSVYLVCTVYRLVDLLSAALMFTSVLNLCWPELSSWLFLFFRPKYLLHEENDDTT